MVNENSESPHADLVDKLMGALSTRTLHHFAAEAQRDGESLKDAFERYDIDYAWFVLGSERMRQETVALLETRLQHGASEAQKASVAAILKSAAAAQPSELLMSFDNDVSATLTDLLCAS